MPEETTHQRLPRNFHRTFKPERQYIHAMLRFAASGREGDAVAISEATGVPTGASTGKVPAILDYCRGMGLIVLGGPERSAVKRPELTAFGRIVLSEDPYLALGATQWIAHLNLCGSITGADAWHRVFVDGTHALGMRFERERLEEYLGMTYRTAKGGLIGPMVGMYEDSAAFAACGALSEAEGVINRREAPLADEMGLGYGAWMLQLLKDHFPSRRQVPVTELDAVAGWRTIPGWNSSNLQRALELMSRKGLVEVDRHMDPWLVAPLADAEQAWRRIYEDML